MADQKQDNRDVWIDGSIYAQLALMGFATMFFGTKDAERFMSEESLFWLRGSLGAWTVVLTSVRAFRSQIFSKARSNGNGNGSSSYSISGGPTTPSTGNTTIIGK